jgi:probable addiction module antidote protein
MRMPEPNSVSLACKTRGECPTGVVSSQAACCPQSVGGGDGQGQRQDQTIPWDGAAYAKTDRDIPNYLAAVFEDGDPALITHALGVVARAKGMSQIAQLAGLGRESLYKALSPGGNPEFRHGVEGVARARPQAQGGGLAFTFFLGRFLTNRSNRSIQEIETGDLRQMPGRETAPGFCLERRPPGNRRGAP